MLSKEQILALFKATLKADSSAPTASYSFNGENLNYDAMNETLRSQLNELYQADRPATYKLMEQAIDDILPMKVLQRYGDFAETRVFGQGDRPIFTRKVGRMRAKQFVTRVGLAGKYEAFKLGETSFEMKTSAIGAAAQIGFEEYLDGRANIAEYMDIIMEGMDDLIYREIAKALMASINQLPAANQVAVAGFDEAGMDRLISVASVYGTPTIYCTREFAVKMIPQTGWISDNMRDQMWNQGYLGNYKGVRVIVLPQSFEDETNSKKVIDPGYAWVIPSGGNDKPVKIAFEGTTHIRELNMQADWSTRIELYRKVGVGVIMTNNLCSYIDTQLQGQMDTIPVVSGTDVTPSVPGEGA